MDVTKPYKFIGFGAMDATKPYKFIGFGTPLCIGGYIRPGADTVVPKGGWIRARRPPAPPGAKPSAQGPAVWRTAVRL